MEKLRESTKKSLISPVSNTGSRKLAGVCKTSKQ